MYYITGRYDMAYEFYNRAVHQKPSEVQVLLRLHLNLAACGLKLKIFERVLEHCNAALLLDVNNSKALLRRAMSYEGLGLYEQGIADAELVLKYEIHTSLRNPAFHILNRLNSLRQQDNVAKTKDIRPGSFITSAQTIRLCFSSPHIPIINGNNSHEFRFFCRMNWDYGAGILSMTLTFILRRILFAAVECGNVILQKLPG
jgi:tetratricopeptide (TPR) repeat protein